MKILMFIISKYPFKDSTANRVFGIAKSFSKLKHDVTVTTIDESVKEKSSDNINILPLYKTKSTKIGKLLDRLFISRFIKRNRLKGKIDVVYFSYRSISLFSLIYLKIHKIKIISDAMEFHNLNTKDFLKKMVFNFRTLFLLPFTKNIICISEAFYSFYKNKNKLLLYPQVDTSKFNPIVNFNNKISLFCGGVGDKKDYTWVLISFFIEYPDYLDFFDLNIVGMSKNALLKRVNRKVNKEVVDKIKFYGFVDKHTFLDLLHSSDFSCVLRPNKRFAKYGFPSKVPESLAAGIPIICNFTSDLKYVLEDGKDSIMVEKCNISSVKKSLDRIKNMDTHTIECMKKNARAKSNLFSYSNMEKINEISDFLLKLK